MKNENQKNYILIKEIILFQVYIFFYGVNKKIISFIIQIYHS